MPMVQFSLPAMLDLAEYDPDAEDIGIERVVELMCHAPARIFGIKERGFIRPGYYADLVLVEKLPLPGYKIKKTDVKSKCGWTPLLGRSLGYRVRRTVVNGGRGARPLEFE